jgi:hypothetical protein
MIYDKITLEVMSMTTRTGEPQTEGPKKEATAERAAIIRAVKGKYARVPTSSEELAKRKEKEMEREEKRS